MHRFSPRATKKECSPLDLFVLAQCDPFQVSDLQNCNIICSLCIKLLSLRYSSHSRLIEEPICTSQTGAWGSGAVLNPHYVHQALALVNTILSTKYIFKDVEIMVSALEEKKFTNQLDFPMGKHNHMAEMLEAQNCANRIINHHLHGQPSQRTGKRGA